MDRRRKLFSEILSTLAPNLEALTVPLSFVGGACREAIGNLQHLRSLTISRNTGADCFIEVAELRALLRQLAPKLVEFHVCQGRYILPYSQSDMGRWMVEELSGKAPRLQMLSLRYAYYDEPAPLDKKLDFPALTCLSLHGIALGFTPNQQLPRLTHLQCVGTDLRNVDFLVSSTVRVLDIREQELLHLQHLKILFDKCPALEKIYIGKTIYCEGDFLAASIDLKRIHYVHHIPSSNYDQEDGDAESSSDKEDDEEVVEYSEEWKQLQKKEAAANEEARLKDIDTCVW